MLRISFVRTRDSLRSVATQASAHAGALKAPQHAAGSMHAAPTIVTLPI